MVALALGNGAVSQLLFNWTRTSHGRRTRRSETTSNSSYSSNCCRAGSGTLVTTTTPHMTTMVATVTDMIEVADLPLTLITYPPRSICHDVEAHLLPGKGGRACHGRRFEIQGVGAGRQTINLDRSAEPGPFVGRGW